MSPDTAKLLVKAILLFNDKRRYTDRHGKLDSYVLATEFSRHLTANGYNWLDTELQPPPSNLRK